MPTTYPGAVDSFSVPAGGAVLGTSTPTHRTQHQDFADAIVAVQTEVGRTSTPAAGTVRARLADLESAAVAFSKRDDRFTVIGSADATKSLRFEADAQSTGAQFTLSAGAQAASRQLSVPVLAADDTLMVLGAAQTRTATLTVRAAGDALRVEAAATQDAIGLRGRAGGTGSFEVALTPAALTADRTATLPDASGTVALRDVAQTFSARQTLDLGSGANPAAASYTNATFHFMAPDGLTGSIVGFSFGSSNGGSFRGVGAGGTRAAPTALADNGGLAGLFGSGYNGSIFTNQSALTIRADGAWSGSNHGCFLDLELTEPGQTASVRMLRVMRRALIVGADTPVGAERLRITGGSSPGTPAGDDVLVGNGRIALGAVSGHLAVGADKVVGARITGWTAPTGAANRGTFATSTVTLEQLAERVKALIDDGFAHGFIGT